MGYGDGDGLGYWTTVRVARVTDTITGYGDGDGLGYWRTVRVARVTDTITGYGEYDSNDYGLQIRLGLWLRSCLDNKYGYALSFQGVP